MEEAQTENYEEILDWYFIEVLATNLFLASAIAVVTLVQHHQLLCDWDKLQIILFSQEHFITTRLYLK